MFKTLSLSPIVSSYNFSLAPPHTLAEWNGFKKAFSSLQIFGHRGCTLAGVEGVLENALPCFVSSFAHNNGTELDLRVFDDFQLVVSHDPLGDHTASLLTLDDFFTCVSQTVFSNSHVINLEIKEPGVVALLARDINRYESVLPEGVTLKISTFYKDVVTELVQYSDRFKSMAFALLLDDKAVATLEGGKVQRLYEEGDIKDLLRTVRSVGFNATSIHIWDGMLETFLDQDELEELGIKSLLSYSILRRQESNCNLTENLTRLNEQFTHRYSKLSCGVFLDYPLFGMGD